MWDKVDGTMVSIPPDAVECVRMGYKIILRCGIVSERVARLRGPSSRCQDDMKMLLGCGLGEVVPKI